MKTTQTTRLIAFLRTHPEATSLEVTLATGIVNVTGRVSDARAQGFVIECIRRGDGYKGYVVREKPVQLQLGCDICGTTEGASELDRHAWLHG